MDVVLFHESFDRRALDDDKLATVAGACFFGTLDQRQQAVVDAVTASINKRAHDDPALTFRSAAPDQVLVQCAEYKIGEVIQKPHRKLNVARHSNTAKSGFVPRSVNLHATELGDTISETPFDLMRVF